MNKQEILRKHLGQTPAEFQDLGKKNTLDAMEEYAELYHQDKVKTLGLFSVSKCADTVIDYIENDAEIAMPIDEMFNEDGSNITKKKYGKVLLKYLVKELREHFC